MQLRFGEALVLVDGDGEELTLALMASRTKTLWSIRVAGALATSAEPSGVVASPLSV